MSWQCKGRSNAIRERRGRRERGCAAQHRAQPGWIAVSQRKKKEAVSNSTEGSGGRSTWEWMQGA
eukprot:6214728-Pleurochrysis_carterae.AAC.3